MALIGKLLVIVSVFTLAICVLGCSGLHLTPQVNTERADLDADDVVIVLSALGFSDTEIVNRGREFRNDLAAAGAVAVRRGDSTVAMVAARGGLLHVTSVASGSFVYDPASKRMY